MKSKKKEPVIRHTFSTRISRFFDEVPWWVDALATGAEANTHYIDGDREHSGFIDDLVGYTAIEYERDITIPSIYSDGYHQVKQYCSSLVNKGVQLDEIFGILSDTLRWHVYKITILEEKPLGSYSADDIQLNEIMDVDLTSSDPLKEEKMCIVFDKYIGRAESRVLSSFNLATDLGFESKVFIDNNEKLLEEITRLSVECETCFKVVTRLWIKFISYLGCSEDNNFSMEVYVNEFYIMTIAKLLCANIIQGKGIISDREELVSILRGDFFTKFGIENFVEYDYYGWLNHVNSEVIIGLAATIQKNLSAYSYKDIDSDDIFSNIMSSFTAGDKRLLLGQENTPGWLAKDIVSNALSSLRAEERPKVLDMCCGTGAFIVQIIKQTMDKYEITPNSPQELIKVLFQSATGFDIDPLSVILSKTNWILQMKDFIDKIQFNITIPIYHADSLYSKSLVSDLIPDENGMITLDLDGELTKIPGELLQPTNSLLFDNIMVYCHDKAMTMAYHNTTTVDMNHCFKLITEMIDKTGKSYTGDIRLLSDCIGSLLSLLARLQIEGRNGIWTFVFENSYRPSLVRNSFNRITSNPPWLALSKIPDNPFKTTIRQLSEYYNIEAEGSSKLHTELATIFLINAVNYYLRQNGLISCVLPDSVTNGFQHNNFRKQGYYVSYPNIPLVIQEIWDIPKNTFSSKSIVLNGLKKSEKNPDVINGRIYKSDREYVDNTYYVGSVKNNTIWSKEKPSSIPSEGIAGLFRQGADLMPRTAIFFDVEWLPNGKVTVKEIDQDSDKSYLVKDAKTFRDLKIRATNVDGSFVFDCYTSNMLLPFVITPPEKGLLPIKMENGWKQVPQLEMIDYGKPSYHFFKTLYDFIGETDQKYYLKINCRNKLSEQSFKKGQWVVFQGAGGSHICGACLEIENESMIVDQTIYYAICNSKDEAMYYVGMLNSPLLDNRIKESQTRGNFGARHIHKVPQEHIPVYDPNNNDHVQVARIVDKIIESLKTKIILPPIIEQLSSKRDIKYRRKKIKELLEGLPFYNQYVKLCEKII